MAAYERWIERHRRRLAWGRFLERFSEWFAGYLFVFGVVVLAVKLLIPGVWPAVLWLGIAAVPVTAVAWTLSRRTAYSRAESVAMLDRKLDAGGLLMTLSENPDPDWAARLPAEAAWRYSLPRLRPVRVARYLLLPVLFAAAACLIPPREARTEPVRWNAVGHEAASQLNESLKLLDQADVLEEKEKEELREAIEQLAEETRETPLTHEKWETIDALRERLRMRAESASLVASRGEAAAGALAAAEEEGAEPLSAERRARLEQDVLDALKKLSGGTPREGLSPEQADLLRRMVASGKLQLPSDPSERKKAVSQLKDFLKKESKKLSECRSLCCSQCSGTGCKLCQGQKAGENPGRGGITRGRADAEMTWGDESDDQGARFKEVALPPGFLDDPQNDVRSITLVAPDETPADAAPRNAPRADDPATGRETWNRPLRPRHRAAVKGYFNSKTSSDSAASPP